MINVKYLLFTILLIGLWSFETHQINIEKYTKEDGKIVYKYIDHDGTAWEYEKHLVQNPENGNWENITVFNGPWARGSDSFANRNTLASSLTVLLLCVLGRILV